LRICGAKIANIRNSKLVLPDETVGLIFFLPSLEGLSCFAFRDNYSRLNECSQCLRSLLFFVFSRLLFVKFIRTCKQVLQTPCYCVGLHTLAFHRVYQHRHLIAFSAVRLDESELRVRVTMIMSNFSSCPLAKTSSTTSLLDDQKWRMCFVPQDILVLYWSSPLNCGARTLTRSPLTNAQDVCVCVLYTE
jgi:hypothetical protein